MALVGIDPTVSGLGAFFEGKAVGVELRQAEVPPSRDPMNSSADIFAPTGDIGNLFSGQLSGDDAFARIAP